MAKILVVDDDAAVLEMVRSTLESDHHTVETANNGNDGGFLLNQYDYDLAILDWRLPEKHGVELVREYRASGGRIPILMLTGMSSYENKEEGLDSGADDYLTKPFNLKEFGARVRALLRRASQSTDNSLQCGPIRLDPTGYVLTVNGETVELQPKEFQLLEFFLRNQNRVFDQETVLNRVWPSDSDSTVQALRSTMRRLRAKVDPDGKLIRTVHGVGFVMRS